MAEQTARERQAQRISFAYGNVGMHNPELTREDVVIADKNLLTARERFYVGQRVKSAATDPRGPRTGEVIGYGPLLMDLEVAVDELPAFPGRCVRNTSSHADNWQPVGTL